MLHKLPIYPSLLTYTTHKSSYTAFIKQCTKQQLYKDKLSIQDEGLFTARVFSFPRLLECNPRSVASASNSVMSLVAPKK